MKPIPAVRSAAALALLTLLVAGPVRAQTITGVVLDDATERPLQSVELVIINPRGESVDQALSDSVGAFRLELPEAGEYALRGTLIGYAPITSNLLEFGDENVTVEIRMNMEALTLDPIVVQGRARPRNSQLAAFHDRMERSGRSGFGHFIAREDIERRGASRPTDLLRMVPSVRVVPAGPAGNQLLMTGRCVPAIYVDGMLINRYGRTSLDEMITSMDIEGIEVYRGPTAQVDSYYDPTGCGLVLVWSRRGGESGSAWSWKKFFAGVAAVAGLILLGN